MLGIARRLLRRPRLLIIDELSLGLAPVAIDSVLQAISEVRREFHVTFLLIEESLHHLVGRVDRAYAMNRGINIGEGTVEFLAQTDAVVSAYLGDIGSMALRNRGPKEPHAHNRLIREKEE